MTFPLTSKLFENKLVPQNDISKVGHVVMECAHLQGDSTITLAVVIRASYKSSINHFIFKDDDGWK